MKSTDNPDKIMLPWAKDGNKNTIPVNSQVGVVAGAASWTDGFPPLTMTPLAAGGIPPSGLDMNGVLHDLSAQARWSGAGAGAVFDQTFADAHMIGGYPKGARVLRKDGTGYWISQKDDNTTDPESGVTTDWLPAEQPGIQSVTMTSENVTLTPEQYGRRMLVLTGLTTTDLQLFLPDDVPGEWQIINATTGGHNITVRCATGTGASLRLNKPSSGGTASVTNVVSDGVNVYTPAPEVEIPGIPDIAQPMSVVNNVEELRAIEPEEDVCVSTRGYWQQGDPGAGLYVPVTNPSTSVSDNGGTYIRWKGGDKYWALVGTRTVCHWGVMPDNWKSGMKSGVTNASRLAVCGRIESDLVFPPGKFTMETSVELPGIGTSITGAGAGTDYVSFSDAGTLINFSAGNLIFKAGTAGSSTNQISCVSISDVKIRGMSGTSVSFEGTGIGQLLIDSLRFSNSSFLGTVYAAKTSSVLYRSTFLNCSFGSSGVVSFSHIMDVSGGLRSQNNTFIGCKFLLGTDGISYGLTGDKGQFVTISCVFGDYTSAAIRTNATVSHFDFGSTFAKCNYGILYSGTVPANSGCSKMLEGTIFSQNTSGSVALVLSQLSSRELFYPLNFRNVQFGDSTAVYAISSGVTAPITLNGASVDVSCIGNTGGSVQTSQISSNVVFPANVSGTTYVAGSGISINGNVISATGSSGGTTINQSSGVYVKRIFLQNGMNHQNVWTIPTGAVLSRYRVYSLTGSVAVTVCWYSSTERYITITGSQPAAIGPDENDGVWHDIKLNQVSSAGNNVVYVYTTAGTGTKYLDVEYYIPQ